MFTAKRKTAKKPVEPTALAAKLRDDEPSQAAEAPQAAPAPADLVLEEMRASLPENRASALQKAMDQSYADGGAVAVAFCMLRSVFDAAVRNVLVKHESVSAQQDRFACYGEFFKVCDKLNILSETTKAPTEVAARFDIDSDELVQRGVADRTATLLGDIIRTLCVVEDGRADFNVRNRLVMLAPEIWSDETYDAIEALSPLAPKAPVASPAPLPKAAAAAPVRRAGIGKQPVQHGILRCKMLPGRLSLEVSSSAVTVGVPDVRASRKGQKADVTVLHDKSFNIFAAVDLVRGLGEAVSRENCDLVLLNALIAQDAIALMAVMGVFAIAAPLDLDFDDPAHAVVGQSDLARFASFGGIALHHTPPSVYFLTEAVLRLAPRLICDDQIKSDIFDGKTFAGIQLAFNTVAFYLALHATSKAFPDLVGNTPPLTCLSPLILQTLTPVSVPAVMCIEQQPTSLGTHPLFKNKGPGIVSTADLLFYAFAMSPDIPAPLVVAMRQHVPVVCHERMIAPNVGTQAVTGLNSELIANDPPVAVAAFSNWLTALAARAYRSKPAADSPLRDLYRAFRDGPDGVFDGSSDVFDLLCKQPARIDPIFTACYAASGIMPANDGFDVSVLLSFIKRSVDERGNLVVLSWEADVFPAKRKRGAASADADDDDDAAAAAPRAPAKRKRSAAAAAATSADDDDDDDDDVGTVYTTATRATRATTRTRAPPAKRRRGGAAAAASGISPEMAEMMARMIQESVKTALAAAQNN
jgi:hypothetical protein